MTSGRRDNYAFLTHGAIPRVIGTMAVPTIISMLVTSLYNVADTFFVGKIDTPSTAAIGVVFALMSIIHAVGFFFGHGSGNYISRRLGAKDKVHAEHMGTTAFVYSLLAGLLFTVAGLCLRTPLALALGSTPTILPYAEEYMSIILLGAPLMTGSLTLNNQMRFQGNSFYAMIGIVTGAVVNVALDPILIIGLDWGVRGAAIATVSGQFISFLLLLYLYRRGDNIRINLRLFSSRLSYVREIIAGGTPSLLRQTLGCVATILLNVTAAQYGDAAIAAMSILARITFVVFSIIIGLGQGFQPLCGFSYGAGMTQRVSSAFWFCVKVGTVFLTTCAVVGFLFAPQIIGVFRDDSAVVAIGEEALRWQMLSYPLGALTMLSNMMLQTIRMPWRANLLATARRGLFFIPLILILPHFMGLRGIEVSQPLSDALAFVLTLPILYGAMKEMKAKNRPAV